MPWIERDEAGKIVGLYAVPQAGLTEHLPDDNAEVVAFRNPPAPLSVILDTIFNQLPAEVRAQFFPLKAAVKLALDQGDLEAAKYIVQLTTVPPELEGAKTQMLAVFNG